MELNYVNLKMHEKGCEFDRYLVLIISFKWHLLKEQSE